MRTDCGFFISDSRTGPAAFCPHKLKVGAGSLFMILMLCGCFPAHKTPQELATWAECKPGMIASWQGGAITYREQDTWIPASAVMERRAGDCKGYSAISVEALESCGIDARIIKVYKGKRVHAVTVFTLQDGRRGFIDGVNSRTYPYTTEWSEIVADIPGGPWTAKYVGEYYENN